VGARQVREARAGAFPRFTLTAGGCASTTRASRTTSRTFPPSSSSSSPSSRRAHLGPGNGAGAVHVGQVGAAIRGAKSAWPRPRISSRLWRQAVRRDVTAAFYNVLLAKELGGIAQRNVHRSSGNLDEATARYEAGVATDYDVLAARVALDNARPEAIAAAQQRPYGSRQLGFLLAEEGLEVDARQPGGRARGGTSLPGACGRGDRAEARGFRAGAPPEVARELAKIAGASDKPRLDLRGGYGGRWIDNGFAKSSGGT